jgi:hypothetical protein
MSFSTTDDSTFTFTICNYAQGAKTNWAKTDIKYTLVITLLDSSNNEVTDETVLSKFKITKIASNVNTSENDDDTNNNSTTDDSNSDDTTVEDSSETVNTDSNAETYSIYDWQASQESNEMTLKSDEKNYSEDTFEIMVPKEYVGKYKIMIVAESKNNTSYLPLGRIISTSESTASTHWTYTFTDSIVDTNKQPSELGSVNIKISGQENEYIEISWDTDYFEIDPWFLVDLEEELEQNNLKPYLGPTPSNSGTSQSTVEDNATSDSDDENNDDSTTVESQSDSSNYATSGNYVTLTFEVGSTNQPNQYYISFFRTQSAKTLEESWSEMKKHIIVRCLDDKATSSSSNGSNDNSTSNDESTDKSTSNDESTE